VTSALAVLAITVSAISLGEVLLHSYSKPIQELFAGLYEEVERNVAERARIASHRETRKLRPKREEVIKRIITKKTA
jgi:hypothetical protein